MSFKGDEINGTALSRALVHSSIFLFHHICPEQIGVIFEEKTNIAKIKYKTEQQKQQQQPSQPQAEQTQTATAASKVTTIV